MMQISFEIMRMRNFIYLFIYLLKW